MEVKELVNFFSINFDLFFTTVLRILYTWISDIVFSGIYGIDI